MKRYSRNYFFETPATGSYDRFSKNNKPSKETFLKWCYSVPFFEETESSASATEPGLVKIASDSNAAGRTEITGDVFQQVVVPYQLPFIYVSEPEGHNEVSTESASGLKVSNLLNSDPSRLDFFIELLHNSATFEFNASAELQLKNDGTPTAGQYYGTSGDTTRGWFDLPADEKASIAGKASTSADYLSATFFEQWETTNIVPLMAEGYFWIGYDYGAGMVYAKQTEALTAFNKNFGYGTTDIVEIGATLAATSVLVTNGDRKMITETKGTAHNKDFAGTGSATTVSRSDHVHNGFTQGTNGFVPAPEISAGKFLRDDGVWATPSSDAGTYKVLAAAADTSADYLDGKINTNFFEISSNKISIKDNTLGYTQIDKEVIQSFSVTITSGDILTLNSTPITLVTCPTNASGDYEYAIRLIDYEVIVDYSTAAYATNTTLEIYCDNATEPQAIEQYALTSTADRIVIGDMNYISDASSTQIVTTDNLKVKVSTGNPTAGGGSITIKGRYRLLNVYTGGGGTF